MKAVLRQANTPVGDNVPATVATAPVVGSAIPAGVSNATLEAIETRELAHPVRVPSALATRADTGPLCGQFDDSDVRLPRLQIVQGNGQLSTQYSQGTLLFMQEVLFPATDPKGTPPSLRFVPIALRKQFRENLEPGSEELPRIFDTMEQVRAVGGTTDWIGDEKPSWSPSAQVLLMLERPENIDHPGFSLSFNGKDYGPAMYYASGGAYRALALQIYNAGNFILKTDGKTDLSKRFWSLRVVRKIGAHVTFVPESRMLTELVPQDLKEICASFITAKTE